MVSFHPSQRLVVIKLVEDELLSVTLGLVVQKRSQTLITVPVFGSLASALWKTVAAQTDVISEHGEGKSTL